jgi:hypothetical protein
MFGHLECVWLRLYVEVQLDSLVWFRLTKSFRLQLTRNQPYHDKSYQEILKAVYMGAPLPVEIPDTVDPVMKQLTLDCLKQDPEQRICFKEILSRLDAHYRTLTAGAQR